MPENLAKQLKKLPPGFRALLIQLVSIALALFAIVIFSIKPTLLAFAFACGLLAAILSYLARLPRWWLFIQLLFAPAMVAALTINIPPHFFLIGFVILLLVYWNSFRSRVPLYLSSNQVWHALAQLLPPPRADKGFTFIDIGCGLGGVLTFLARARPDGRYFGVESAPLPFLWCWLRIQLGGYGQCKILWGNLWQCDLSDYDIVFAYLSPAPMARLWQKAQAEMRPGTLFISSTFTVPGQTPTETIQVNDLHNTTLLIWRM